MRDFCETSSVDHKKKIYINLINCRGWCWRQIISFHSFTSLFARDCLFDGFNSQLLHLIITWKNCLFVWISKSHTAFCMLLKDTGEFGVFSAFKITIFPEQLSQLTNVKLFFSSCLFPSLVAVSHLFHLHVLSHKCVVLSRGLFKTWNSIYH